MAQHYRTLISIRDQDDGGDLEMNFHQCSVVDIIHIDGAIHIDYAVNAAAAILEMYRFRGHDIDELLEEVKQIIQDWDITGNNSLI